MLHVTSSAWEIAGAAIGRKRVLRPAGAASHPFQQSPGGPEPCVAAGERARPQSVNNLATDAWTREDDATSEHDSGTR